MFNAPRPNPEDLPTPAQLRRSTVLAALGAVAIAVCVVMPAEYGDDPTGVGALLVSAVNERNYPIVLGAVLVTTGIIVLATLVSDLVVAWLDPRQREAL